MNNGQTVETAMKSTNYVYLLVGLLLSVTLVSQTQANDRSIRGLMIPASSCQTYVQASGGSNCVISPEERAGRFTGNAWTAYPAEPGICQFVFVCPLPINNIELGGTSTDNDISKFRVHFRKPTLSNSVIARLIKSQVSGANFVSSSVCGGLLMAATTAPTTTTVSCPHDVAGAGTFYHFEVILVQDPSSLSQVSQFYGIDFP